MTTSSRGSPAKKTRRAGSERAESRAERGTGGKSQEQREKRREFRSGTHLRMHLSVNLLHPPRGVRASVRMARRQNARTSTYVPSRDAMFLDVGASLHILRIAERIEN